MSDTERKHEPNITTVTFADYKEATVPPTEDRRRSRSPRKDKARRKDAGFKWKEKRRDEDGEQREEGLRRGYREHHRARSRSRSPRGGGRDRRDGDRDYERRDRDRDRDRDRNRDRRQDDHRDRDRDRDRNRDPDSERRPSGRSQEQRDKDTSTPKPAPPTRPAAAAVQPEMIVVTVNDRLGTKKQIPCLPTDTIKDFKSVVAMMIGRRPHEILLKRQSERPFKDFLTLQDYGVSNNVQLDLEVDTGD